VDTDAIEPELLTRYLIGGEDEHGEFQMGDVENTEKVFLAQVERAREVGQVPSILLNMGGLMFTIEAERNGMFVDKPRGLEIAAALAVKIAAFKVELDKYLPVMPPDFGWKWTSRKKLSALIFGGRVKYETDHIVHADGSSTDKREWQATPADKRGAPVYYQKTAKHLQFADGTTDPRTIEQYMEALWYDPSMPAPLRFAGGLNKGEVKYKNITGPDIERGPKTRRGDSYFTFPRMTEPKPEWETADLGVYSVGEEVIEALGNRNIPFLKALSKLAAMTKDLGTYYITTDDEGNQKGMLTLVGIDGIVHHKLNMTATVTARLSSSDPNLQNLSNGGKSDVKTIFVSRFGPDGKIIQSDFTSLEVYVQAILTGAKQLILDLQAGLDMHVVRVSQKEGIPYEEAFDKAKVQKLAEWIAKRQGAKEYSFQAAYGAGDAKIAESTGMDIDDVARFRAADEERYPEMGVYYDELTSRIKANRRPTQRFVPHPEVRGRMVQLGRSSYRTPDGKLYSYSESPSPAYLVRRGIDASFSPTEIKNYVVQGTGGEWAKAAMWLALRIFYRYRNWGGFALLVNQVHDAIYADARADVADVAAAALHAAMEGASEFMEYTFNWPIPVPVPSDTSYGPSMASHDPVPGLKDRATAFRKELREHYMGGYVPSFELQGNQ
jgi:hypothetical protein